MKKVEFRHENNIENLKNKIKRGDYENKTIFNFLNQNDLYHLRKNPDFRESILLKNSTNFIDGFIISAALSIKKMKKIRRMTGPVFTREILGEPEISKNSKHFFIGLETKEANEISRVYGISTSKTDFYNPPFIQGDKFPEKEIKKMADKINSFDPDFLWVGVGSPKQNILVKDLFKRISVKKILKINVGAALNFAIGKEKPAPKIVRIIGIEWFYRLVKDFKKTRIKAWRSLVAIRYAFTSIDLDK